MVEDFSLSNHWFEAGIPAASLTAPWQQPYLETTKMYPDETGLVEYKLNSLGYRDEDWTEDDLNDSVWCIGHSDVFGMGVRVEETWTRRLQQISCIRTVNLGIAGASWDTIARVVTCGLKSYTPTYVIIQATTPDRKEFINKDFKQVILPSLPETMLPYKDVWRYHDSDTSQYQTEKNLELIKMACKDTRLIIFDLPNRWDIIASDPAVDKQHIGPTTHLSIARHLAQQILPTGQ